MPDFRDDHIDSARGEIHRRDQSDGTGADYKNLGL